MLQLDEQTAYQQIQEIVVAKEPYERLWNTAVKFHSYHEKWMNGPVLEVIAEDVDVEVSFNSLHTASCNDNIHTAVLYCL